MHCSSTGLGTEHRCTDRQEQDPRDREPSTLLSN